MQHVRRLLLLHLQLTPFVFRKYYPWSTVYPV